MGVCGTLIDSTPRYNEYLRYPRSVLANDSTDGRNFILVSIEWPMGYPNCEIQQGNNISICKNSPPYKGNEFYKNLNQYLHCAEANGDAVVVDTLDVSLFSNPWNNSLSIRDISANGSFCDLFSSLVSNITTDEIYCDIVENPEIGECLNSEGSHAVTFSIYLLLRVAWNIFINNMFNLMDGTSMHLAKTHNGDYAWIIAWNTLAGVFGPMISGALVELSLIHI